MLRLRLRRPAEQLCGAGDLPNAISCRRTIGRILSAISGNIRRTRADGKRFRVFNAEVRQSVFTLANQTAEPTVVYRVRAIECLTAIKQMPLTPPKLRKGDRANFNTLLRAAGNSDLALVSAIRKDDQQPVALVCAMSVNDDETITPVPLAVMVEGNPFELFEDPTI
jgi:hypothetical protein